MLSIKKNSLRFWIILLIIGTIISAFILNQFVFPGYDIERKSDFPNWGTLLLEIFVGVTIALIIYNHTKKTENKELRDLDLTIVGTYYNLWNLYLSMNTYTKSDKVRADKVLGLQILHIANSTHNTLAKCGQKIDRSSIETLQLHLVVIQNIIRALMDPRANIEELWSKNKESFDNILNDLKDLSQKKFEPKISKESKADWELNKDSS